MVAHRCQEDTWHPPQAGKRRRRSQANQTHQGAATTRQKKEKGARSGVVPQAATQAPEEQ